jgi:hypothetical protein
VLVINEARDNEYDRYKFYEHMKIYAAAPPDVLRVNEKYIGEYYVPNLCAPIITTNYKTNGIYLPADDRRHFVAWSDRTEADFTNAYWQSFWRWYREGGFGHVAAWLSRRDISAFNAKAPPPKTEAFWATVRCRPRARRRRAGRRARQARKPRRGHARRSREQGRRLIRLVAARPQEPPPHPAPLRGVRLCPGSQPDRQQGLWVINGSRQVVYGRRDKDQRELVDHSSTGRRGRPGTVTGTEGTEGTDPPTPFLTPSFFLRLLPFSLKKIST